MIEWFLLRSISLTAIYLTESKSIIAYVAHRFVVAIHALQCEIPRTAVHELTTSTYISFQRQARLNSLTIFVAVKFIRS